MYKTTGIGSLPFTTTKEAIEFSLGFDLPFLPELPKLQQSESMLKMLFNVSPHICFDSFLNEVGEREFKVQLPGPYTYAKHLNMPVDLTMTLFKTKLSLTLGKLTGKKFIFFIDEPAIDEKFNLDVKYINFLNFVKGKVPKLGIHSCNSLNPDIFKDHIDIISVDAKLVSGDFKIDICAGVLDSIDNSVIANSLGKSTKYISHNCGLVNSTEINLGLEKLKKFKL